MAVFRDDFNRADVTYSAGTSGGGVAGAGTGYQPVSGTWGIVSNQLKMTSSTASPQLIRSDPNKNPTTQDSYAQVDYVARLGSSVGIGARLSVNGSNQLSYYLFQISGTTPRILRYLNGASTIVASGSAVTWVEGSVLRIECVGTTIRGLINGSVVVSGTNSEVPTSGLGTIIAGTAGVANLIFDNWESGEIVPDTTAPVPTMTAPAAGATVNGTITLSATATDDVAVTGVDFLVNGSVVGAGTLSAGTWSYSFNTLTLANGTHTVQARARDAAGNTGTTTAQNMVVNNPDTTPPTVTLTAPASGATLTGTVTFNATASDNVGVAGVSFLVNGTSVGAGSLSGGVWSYSYDTTALANGAATVAARATDAAGNATTTTAVTVTVSNADTTPPTVTVTDPTGGATISGSYTLKATAADNVAVASVTFAVDGASIGAGTLAAGVWSRALDTATLSNGAHSITATAADAAGNATTSTAVSVTVSNSGPPADTDPVGTTPTRFKEQPDFGSLYAGDEPAMSLYAGDQLIWGYLRPTYAPITPWLGKSITFLGDSSGVVQSGSGLASTDLHPYKVARGWTGAPKNTDYPSGVNASTFTNSQVNSSTSADVAIRLLTASHSQFFTGTAPSDIYAVVVGGNDVAVKSQSAAGEQSYGLGIEAILGILRSTANLRTWGNETGAWGNVTGPFSGTSNTARSTTEPGAGTEQTFTGTACTLILYGLTNGNGSDFWVYVDGVAYRSGTTRGKATTGLIAQTYGPVPVTIQGLSTGTHTIRVVHRGATGDQLIVNSIHPWGASPPTVVVMPPAFQLDSVWSAIRASDPATKARVMTFRQILANKVAKFPADGKIKVGDGAAGDTYLPYVEAGLRISDHLHPNALGANRIAAAILDTLRGAA